jgi:hypothetical protein
MSYMRTHRDPEREPRRITGRLLLEEEARYRQDEHVIRWSREYKPVPKKVKETVGAR